jgi:murein DD-endopeptidase MepM/ murein hydrolase activator NlpD
MKTNNFLKNMFRRISSSTYVFIKNVLSIIGLFSIITIISSSVKFTDTSAYLLSQNIYLETKIHKLDKKYDELLSKINIFVDEDNDMYRELLGIDTVNYKNNDVYDVNIFINKDDTGGVADMNRKYFYASKILSSMMVSKGELKKLMKQEGTSNFSNIPLMQPIRTEDVEYIPSTFGLRFHPFYKKVIFHDGVDISAKSGSKIVATASGTVDIIIHSNLGYGNKIVINHGNGYETLYAHLKFIKVRKGQYIKQGQVIGEVGSTGLSTGDHLHYEIRYNDELKDPLAYFQTYLTPIGKDGEMTAYKPLK